VFLASGETRGCIVWMNKRNHRSPTRRNMNFQSVEREVHLFNTWVYSSIRRFRRFVERCCGKIIEASVCERGLESSIGGGMGTIRYAFFGDRHFASVICIGCS
jgi:hypothetical protein